MTANAWYYAQFGQQIGPVSQSTLQSLLSSGQLAQDSLVWCQGMTEWQPAHTVPQLMQAGTGFSSSPPQMPPSGYAGFLRRLFAMLLDGLVLSFLSGVLLAFTGLTDVGLLSCWLYFSLFESSKYQATPGKMALGIYVTDLNGQRISFPRATGRHWAKYLSTLVLMAGWFFAAFSDRKQALHDILASCLVVKKG